MTFSKLNAELDHISRLADQPGRDIGTAELKARFDLGSREIKQYINEVLTVELDRELALLREQLRILSLPRDICWQVKQGSAYLPADAWLADGGLYRCSIADAEISAGMTVQVHVDAADLAAVGGLPCRVDAYDGGFTLRLPQLPQSGFGISYRVVAQG